MSRFRILILAAAVTAGCAHEMHRAIPETFYEVATINLQKDPATASRCIEQRVNSGDMGLRARTRSLYGTEQVGVAIDSVETGEHVAVVTIWTEAGDKAIHGSLSTLKTAAPEQSDAIRAFVKGC